jgi:hypothetical protein
MIAKEIESATNYLNDGYLGSALELKWGLNVLSDKKYLVTPA